MELRKNRFIFGFANGQPLLYISNVEIVYKKSAILTDNTFSIFPLTRLYRWVISASLCLILTVLRNTLRIYDFVPRFSFPLFPILLQLGSKSFT